MAREHQKQIDKFFDRRPILYQPGLAIVLESVNAAIILYQLLYWHQKGKREDGFIFKTSEELRRETGLSRTQQDNGIRRLISLGIVDKKLAQIPAKRHFRVNFVELQKRLPGLKQTYKLTYMNPPIYVDDNLQPITKSTQKTTTNNTNNPP